MTEEGRLEFLIPHLTQMLVTQFSDWCEYALKLRHQPSNCAVPLCTQLWWLGWRHKKDDQCYQCFFVFTRNCWNVLFPLLSGVRLLILLPSGTAKIRNVQFPLFQPILKLSRSQEKQRIFFSQDLTHKLVRSLVERVWMASGIWVTDVYHNRNI